MKLFLSIIILGLFTSSSKALFSSQKSSVMERATKVRKFTPQIIKDKSTNEIRSVLEFPIQAEDHQSVYKCRAFAEATMSAPKESALKATFNVTCEFFILYLPQFHTWLGLCK